MRRQADNRPFWLSCQFLSRFQLWWMISFVNASYSEISSLTNKLGLQFWCSGPWKVRQTQYRKGSPSCSKSSHTSFTNCRTVWWIKDSEARHLRILFSEWWNCFILASLAHAYMLAAKPFYAVSDYRHNCFSLVWVPWVINDCTIQGLIVHMLKTCNFLCELWSCRDRDFVRLPIVQKGSHLLLHRAIVEEGLDNSSSFWASLRSCPMDPRIRQDITNRCVYCIIR